MNYEIERALSNKVDEWRFNGLQSEVEHLKQENNALREEINNARNQAYRLQSTMEFIINAIIESSDITEDFKNAIQNAKVYL